MRRASPAVSALRILLQRRIDLANTYGQHTGDVGASWVNAVKEALRVVQQAERKAKRSTGTASSTTREGT